MANQEHLNILKQGVEVWNQWREVHTDIIPDLSGANLSGANLYQANLMTTDLSGANLYQARLSGAKLNGVKLFSADLTGADLFAAFFLSAKLSGADLTDAACFSTYFIETDLQATIGLESVKHFGSSIIDIHTLYLSKGNIPEVFLKGAGVDDTFITYIRSLVGKPFEYYSCFISYSSKDDAFARRLYADLQSHNVRCWFAPEDLKWGDRIRTGSEAFFRIDPFKVRRSCSRQLPSNAEAAPGLLSTIFCLAMPPS